MPNNRTIKTALIVPALFLITSCSTHTITDTEPSDLKSKRNLESFIYKRINTLNGRPDQITQLRCEQELLSIAQECQSHKIKGFIKGDPPKNSCHGFVNEYAKGNLEYLCEGGSTQKKQLQNKYKIVETYYATNRRIDKSPNNKKKYTDHRSPSINYGIVKVTVPTIHELGKIESPSFLAKIFSRKTDKGRDKYFTILDAQNLDVGKYFASLRKRLTSTKNNILIFFHGYNVSFEEAAKRTAQMSVDLKFDGAPIFFSWPSSGKISRYIRDEASIKWATPDIKKFLLDISSKHQSANIFLVGHSMGTRGLTRALSEIYTANPNVARNIKEIILTAPDIDSDIFKREILPKLSKSKTPLTLYASSNDKALLASKKIHGYPRAGEAGKTLIVDKRLETIDASNVETGILGHSYFSETRTVLSDIHELVSKKIRADERFSLQRSSDGKHWVFRN